MKLLLSITPRPMDLQCGSSLRPRGASGLPAVPFPGRVNSLMVVSSRARGAEIQIAARFQVSAARPAPAMPRSAALAADGAGGGAQSRPSYAVAAEGRPRLRAAVGAVNHSLCVSSRARRAAPRPASRSGGAGAELWGLFGASRSKPLAEEYRLRTTFPWLFPPPSLLRQCIARHHRIGQVSHRPSPNTADRPDCCSGCPPLVDPGVHHLDCIRGLASQSQ